jgi:heme exporter protein D
MSTYFAMGGHAGFIWPSYAISALVLIALAVVSFRRARAAQRALDGLDRGRR